MLPFGERSDCSFGAPVEVSPASFFQLVLCSPVENIMLDTSLQGKFSYLAGIDPAAQEYCTKLLDFAKNWIICCERGSEYFDPKSSHNWR